MDGPERQSPPTTWPAGNPAAGDAADPVVTAGRNGAQPIDLGMGRRRVTGDDLFVFHALVSGNDQTFEELTDLRPGSAAAPVRQSRPTYVTDGWLDRVNGRLSGWLSGIGQTVGQWVRGQPDVPLATDLRRPVDRPTTPDRTNGPASPHGRAPKRAA